MFRTPPFYPPSAEYFGVEGNVLLSITIQADGSVSDAHVAHAEFWTKSGGSPDKGAEIDLEKSAIEAVKNWHYMAATLDGKAVSTTICQPIHFTLTPHQ